MYLGGIMELAESQELYRDPRHPYTTALFSAIPVADPDYEKQCRRISLERDVPSPVDPPAGCKFCGRCGHARPVCREKAPELHELSPGHFCACHLYG